MASKLAGLDMTPDALLKSLLGPWGPFSPQTDLERHKMEKSLTGVASLHPPEPFSMMCVWQSVFASIQTLFHDVLCSSLIHKLLLELSGCFFARLPLGSPNGVDFSFLLELYDWPLLQPSQWGQFAPKGPTQRG